MLKHVKLCALLWSELPVFEEAVVDVIPSEAHYSSLALMEKVAAHLCRNVRKSFFFLIAELRREIIPF